MHQEDNDNKLSRRTYLAGGASLAAGSLLAACGGGDSEDIDEQNDVSAKVAANGLIVARQITGTPLVNSSLTNREIYWIEVVHRTGKRCEVSFSEKQLIPGNDLQRIWVNLSNRASFGGAVNQDHHAINFATLDTGPKNSSTSNDLRRLRNESSIQVDFEKINNPIRAGHTRYDSPFALKIDHNSNGSEIEWLFSDGTYQVTTTNWDVAVRFFRAPAGEIGSSRKTWITETSKFDPDYDAANNRHVIYPSGVINTAQPIITNTSAARHRAGVVPYNSTNKHDSLVLKNTRFNVSQGEMVSPLCANFKCGAHCAHTQRRIARHIENFVKVLHADPSLTNEKRQDALEEELHTTMFGHTMSNEFKKVHNGIKSNAYKNINANFKQADSTRRRLTELLKGVDVKNEGIRYLQGIQKDSKSAYGDTAVEFTSSLQFHWSSPTAGWLGGFGLGATASIRASLPIVSVSALAGKGPNGWYDKEDIYYPGKDGYLKWAMTAAGSLGVDKDKPESFWGKWVGWSVGIEATFYCSSHLVNPKGTRLDRVKIELVADFKTTSFLTKLLLKIGQAFSWVAQQFGFKSSGIFPASVPQVELSNLSSVVSNFAGAGHTEMLGDLAGVMHLVPVEEQVRSFENLGKDLAGLKNQGSTWTRFVKKYDLVEFGASANTYNNLMFQDTFQTGWNKGTSGSFALARKDLNGMGVALNATWNGINYGGVGMRIFNAATITGGIGGKVFHITP